MDLYPTQTHGSAGKISINEIMVRLHGREYRWEGGRWREYMYGRKVITREEMKRMDCPLPPEDPEDF